TARPSHRCENWLVRPELRQPATEPGQGNPRLYSCVSWDHLAAWGRRRQAAPAGWRIASILSPSPGGSNKGATKTGWKRKRRLSCRRLRFHRVRFCPLNPGQTSLDDHGLAFAMDIPAVYNFYGTRGTNRRHGRFGPC